MKTGRSGLERRLVRASFTDTRSRRVAGRDKHLWPNQTYYFRVARHEPAPYAPVAMNRYSIYQNLSLTSFGVDEGIVSDLEWQDDTTAVIKLSGLSNMLEPTDPVLYRLTVHGGSGGVTDIHGNTMSENFVFDFREE